MIVLVRTGKPMPPVKVRRSFDIHPGTRPMKNPSSPQGKPNLPPNPSPNFPKSSYKFGKASEKFAPNIKKKECFYIFINLDISSQL